jgi:hypothetical protein
MDLRPRNYKFKRGMALRAESSTHRELNGKKEKIFIDQSYIHVMPPQISRYIFLILPEHHPLIAQVVYFIGIPKLQLLHRQDGVENMILVGILNNG